MPKWPKSSTSWRQFGLIGVLVGAVAAILAATQALAIDVPALRDRLEKGLKARTDADFAFLDRVIESIEDGDLPQPLVDRVFFWARKKAAEHQGNKAKRPMIYFRPALTNLAARIGVDLD
jgi:hypothetical protein